MQTWQLQEAKARLSELVKRAATEGRQEITVRGEAAAVVPSRAEHEKLKYPRNPNNRSSNSCVHRRATASRST